MPDFGSPLARPTFVIQGWGEPRSDHTHEGLDFPTPVGTPVYAIGDGTVITSVDAPTAASGNYVAIQHDDGFISRYMHLTDRGVQRGDKINRGQIIATSGNTGIENSGPHLHFDIKMVPSLLSNYSSRYATPAGGFGRTQFEGTGVPAEPLIPVDVYSDEVKKKADQFGISLYEESDMLPILLMGVGGFLLWQLLRK